MAVFVIFVVLLSENKYDDDDVASCVLLCFVLCFIQSFDFITYCIMYVVDLFKLFSDFVLTKLHFCR